MIVLRTIGDVRSEVLRAQRLGKQVGFVPTMGALHAGHGALIQRARSENDLVVVSIFVNPMQFHQADDLAKYPRPFEADCDYCRSLAADIVFVPEVREMYPEERLTSIRVDKVSSGLCGDYRPGHFEGVATVVAKLFHIVPANRAYFGEKDAQQLAVIQKMVADLNFAVEIVPVPTVREPDGLAMSSRNLRLSAEDRKVAPIIFRSLEAARAKIVAGERSAKAVRCAAMEALQGHKVEYLEVVDSQTMQPVQQIDRSVRIVAAVWIGGVRLIDNVLAEPGPKATSWTAPNS